MLVLGNTLFVDKSGSRIISSFILEVKKEDARLSHYSWGSATLPYLYRQLGIASRIDCKQITGCLTLLQSWIYEYFPAFRPIQGCLAIAPTDGRAAMWDTLALDRDYHRVVSFCRRLDQMTDREIPHPILRPDYAYRPGYATRSYVVSSASAPQFWDRFHSRSYCIPLSDYLPLLDEEPTCSDDYLEWFYTYSHPCLMSTDEVLRPPPRPNRTNVDYWVQRFMSPLRKFIAEKGGNITPTVIQAQEAIMEWNAMLED
ncbi:uncharacterized protein LOC110696364 [Chenopodium quinoa]|uniref:uncharacterized protein LOC110696364 n=1 Tax=Chenopodium quinoa TaxID=63459 RepID=UPI000B76C9FF|nr:uncharacterized protein LOC110696364 [Chenopodium quinoa]